MDGGELKRWTIGRGEKGEEIGGDWERGGCLTLGFCGKIIIYFLDNNRCHK